MSVWSIETAVSAYEGAYHTTVSSAWNIGNNPNGGYLTSIVLQAMASHLAGNSVALPDPISMTTHFLKPGIGDLAADITVELVRAGRNVATLQGTLSQAGQPRLIVLAMFGDVSATMGVTTQLSMPVPDMPPVDACVPRTGDTQGLQLPLMDRLNVMLDPAYAQPGQSDKARVQGWIRLADGSEAHSLCLPLFCDAFPPSVLAYLGAVGWVPTLELTVHVRRRPQPGWIRGCFETEDLSGGRMIETGALWDETCTLVAQSRQIGLVMQGD